MHRWAHRVGMEGGLQGSTWGAHRGPGGYQVMGSGVSGRRASSPAVYGWLVGVLRMQLILGLVLEAGGQRLERASPEWKARKRPQGVKCFVDMCFRRDWRHGNGV